MGGSWFTQLVAEKQHETESHFCLFRTNGEKSTFTCIRETSRRLQNPMYTNYSLGYNLPPNAYYNGEQLSCTELWRVGSV